MLSDHAYTLSGLIILLLDLWAISRILTSINGTGSKVLWTFFVLVFPVGGFIAWLLFGPRPPQLPA